MKIEQICITGGTGFVGHSLANKLSTAGYRVKILTRQREATRGKLILLPGVDLIETDIHQQENLDHHFRDCQAVINLVGILNEKGRNGTGFRYAHVELLEKIIAACKANQIQRVLQMSALNADAEKAPSHYLRSKGVAEDLLFNTEGLNVTVFRPSVIFGPGDSFFNRFAGLLKLSPLVFPLACPSAQFAPVYVEDVASAFLQTLTDPASYTRAYCLCGPKTYSLQQLVSYTASCLESGARIIPLSDGLSRLQAMVFDFVPGKPFSTDNYLSASVDSICQENHLEELGIEAMSLEAVVPGYLRAENQRARYYSFRRH